MFVPYLCDLKRKTVAINPNHTKGGTIAFPPKIMQNIILLLCADVVYVNKIEFFTSIPQGLRC